ncbi:helix-turn-helix domain-containing protein [Gulosibacter sediminis]|uniref:helix-turn-helix domain-containing protein n=1 Tax=Gulosibacter sediminis TaxID=1729695 RepID=UPI003D15D755
MNTNTATYLSRDVLNQRIHGLLFSRKVTKKALTEALGLSQPTGSKKLNGHVDWSVPELLTVAVVLDTSVAYLIGEVDDDAPLRKTRNAPAREDQGVRAASADLVAGAGLEPATSRL